MNAITKTALVVAIAMVAVLLLLLGSGLNRACSQVGHYFCPTITQTSGAVLVVAFM